MSSSSDNLTYAEPVVRVRLAGINRAIDRLPVPLVLLAFVAASMAALASGFGAVSANERPPLRSEQAGVELIAGYAFDGEQPCAEILPYSLVVPERLPTVLKCIVVRNTSASAVKGLVLIDTDLGDGPVWIERLEPGAERMLSARVNSEGDLVAITTVEGPSIALRVESRTFRVEGGRLTGTADGPDVNWVELRGRATTGQLVLHESVPTASGRFVFDDLPPSDEAGYRITANGSSVIARSVVVENGDQIDVTDEPLPVSVESDSATDPTITDRAEAELIATPSVLALTEPTAAPTQPLFVVALLLSAAVVVLATAGRGMIPVRRLPAPLTGRPGVRS